MKYGYYWLALALCVGGGPALAADGGDKDVTMTVIEDKDGATERDFVQDIELPEPARAGEARGRGAADEARENSERGRERASEARQQGSENARGRPDEPRDRGGNDGPDGSGQPDQSDGSSLPGLP